MQASRMSLSAPLCWVGDFVSRPSAGEGLPNLDHFIFRVLTYFQTALTLPAPSLAFSAEEQALSVS